MIEALKDVEAFQTRRRTAWDRNVHYWLTHPLRHVVDVGDYIARRVQQLCADSGKHRPVVLDMGCGDCWLLRKLDQFMCPVSYIGVDSTVGFLKSAAEHFGKRPHTTFIEADLDLPTDLSLIADVVVNAFNFFELTNLPCAMQSAASWLDQSGTLIVSTIDKTYLIIALSRNWDELHENLRRYQENGSIKFDFQHIDLGDSLSPELEYPSVLYSTQDYIEAAYASNLRLKSYVEHRFTAKAIPKIYCHFEFSRETLS